MLHKIETRQLFTTGFTGIVQPNHQKMPHHPPILHWDPAIQIFLDLGVEISATPNNVDQETRTLHLGRNISVIFT